MKIVRNERFNFNQVCAYKVFIRAVFASFLICTSKLTFSSCLRLVNLTGVLASEVYYITTGFLDRRYNLPILKFPRSSVSLKLLVPFL
jgi:hypothetical protein